MGRNHKVEHEYKIPEVPDLELYFELVYAFITVIESAILMYANHAYMNFVHFETEETIFSVEYKCKLKTVNFNFRPKEKYIFKLEDYTTFAIVLNIYFWLLKSTVLYNDEFLIEKLESLKKALIK